MRLRPLTDVEVAWLAGIFEGEGTTYAKVRQAPTGASSRTVRVCIAMTDLDVVERIQELFPSPSGIHSRNRGPRWRRIYEWGLGRREDVAAFLLLILPLLSHRRRHQAEKVLAIATDPACGLGSGHRNKTHCPQGHEYTPENTRVQPGNKGRRCRACDRLRAREHRARLTNS